MSDQPMGPDWQQAADGRWYPPPGTPPPPPPPYQPSVSHEKGFFASLYDFSFDSFITPKLIRVFYGIVVIILTAVAGLMLLGALLSGEGDVIVFGLIVVPIAYLLYMIITRIYFELVAAFFRVADDVHAIRRSKNI
jgi:hypothetical protein